MTTKEEILKIRKEQIEQKNRNMKLCREAWKPYYDSIKTFEHLIKPEFELMDDGIEMEWEMFHIQTKVSPTGDVEFHCFDCGDEVTYSAEMFPKAFNDLMAGYIMTEEEYEKFLHPLTPFINRIKHWLYKFVSVFGDVR